MEPAEFFGHFDGAALLVLLLVNIALWKAGWPARLSPRVIIGWLLLFGIVMPFASAFYEARSYQQAIIMTDPKELLYVSFRFPIWWAIGLVQLLVLLFVLVPRRKDHGETGKPLTRGGI